MEQGTVTQPHGQSFIIKRPRLTKLLDESGARIILLLAPAGYGKTTLAREWVGGFRQRVAWYSASPASADVAALATGLAVELDLALGDLDGPCAARLSALAAVQQKPDPLARILASSRTHWPNGLVVAIDDYHHIDGSTAAEEFVGAFVNLLPAAFVITTRARPAWLSPRLAVYGEAFEIGLDDLAMTDAEAEDVLKHSRRPFSGGSISKLARGWPAIIGLAAHTQRSDFPETIPSRLYAFLADDLIAAASPKGQEALTVLAVTGVSNLALAHALLGLSAGRAIEEGARRGLLMVPAPNRIALHPLLRDFLVDRLHQRPGRFLEVALPLFLKLLESRQWDECLNIAESAQGEHLPVPSVLETGLEELLAAGRVATVRRWVEIARATAIDDPMIDLADGEVALRAGEYDRALALGALAAGANASEEVRCRAQLLAAYAARMGYQPVADDWFGRAEANAPNSRLRAAALWGQFCLRYDAGSSELDRALARFGETHDGSVEHEIRLSQGETLLAFAKGSVDRATSASRLVESLIPLSDDPLARLAANNVCAWVLLSGAKYRDAVVVADRGITEAQATGIDFAVSYAKAAKAQAYVGLRRFSAAQHVIDGLASRLREEPDAWTEANVAVVCACLQLSLGDLERAADCLLFAPSVRNGPEMSEHDGYRALIAAARGQNDAATQLIERCIGWSTHADARALAAASEAVIATRLGDERAAIRHFASALATGHRHVIVMACRAYADLARIVVRDSDYGDLLLEILLGSADFAIAKASGLRIPRSLKHKEMLSPRELEVYELMAQGRTNREIGRALFIAESTTKVHVRHIFEKLGVTSRVEAARARPPDESPL